MPMTGPKIFRGLGSLTTELQYRNAIRQSKSATSDSHAIYKRMYTNCFSRDESLSAKSGFRKWEPLRIRGNRWHSWQGKSEDWPPGQDAGRGAGCCGKSRRLAGSRSPRICRLECV